MQWFVCRQAVLASYQIREAWMVCIQFERMQYMISAWLPLI